MKRVRAHARVCVLSIVTKSLVRSELPSKLSTSLCNVVWTLEAKGLSRS